MFRMVMVVRRWMCDVLVVIVFKIMGGEEDKKGVLCFLLIL